MFWTFMCFLIIPAFLFPYVYILLTFPTYFIAKIIDKFEDKYLYNRLFYFSSYTLLILSFIYTSYVFVGWAAYLSICIYGFSEIAKHKWLYYIIGFIAFNVPFKKMCPEKQPEFSVFKTHLGIAIISFILFCIWPKLTIYLYGWIMPKFVENIIINH